MLIHSRKWNHPWDEYSLAGSGGIWQDPKFAAVQQTIVVQMLLIPWLAAQVGKRRSSHFQSIAGSNVGQIIVMGCDRWRYPKITRASICCSRWVPKIPHIYFDKSGRAGGTAHDVLFSSPHIDPAILKIKCWCSGWPSLEASLPRLLITNMDHIALFLWFDSFPSPSHGCWMLHCTKQMHLASWSQVGTDKMLRFTPTDLPYGGTWKMYLGSTLAKRMQRCILIPIGITIGRRVHWRWYWSYLGDDWWMEEWSFLCLHANIQYYFRFMNVTINTNWMYSHCLLYNLEHIHVTAAYGVCPRHFKTLQSCGFTAPCCVKCFFRGKYLPTAQFCHKWYEGERFEARNETVDRFLGSAHSLNRWSPTLS